MWHHATEAMVGGYVQMQECFTDMYTFHRNNTVALSVSFFIHTSVFTEIFKTSENPFFFSNSYITDLSFILFCLYRFTVDEFYSIVYIILDAYGIRK